jgi:cytochrome b subunit of formate dehydrogenase
MNEPFNRLIIRDRIVRVDRVFQRFDWVHRLEHLVLMLVVGVLLLTGLPQKFAQSSLSITLIGWLGGIQTTRQIHRVAAILLMGVALFHALDTAYRFFVLRLPPHVLLLARDLRDLLHGLRHRLGRADEPPDMGRFTYYEKLLYWAVVWSVLVLVVTGLVMWNPIFATRFLTGEIIPAAKRAHGSEALLMLMVGVGWHVWHVVIRQRNWSIFTGVLTEPQQIRHHGIEWDAIMAGRDRLPLDLMATRRRKRIFFPVAALVGLALAGGIAYFVSFEETAVITHEERQPVDRRSASAADPLPAVPATIEADVPMWRADVAPLLRAECGECHGTGSALDLTGYDSLMGSGLIVPGDPAGSALVLVQATRDHPGQLLGDELATVIVWIANGAPR